jgi:hypothetical protein
VLRAKRLEAKGLADRLCPSFAAAHAEKWRNSTRATNMTNEQQQAVTTDYRENHKWPGQEPTTGCTWGVWRFDATTRTLTCDPGPICDDGKQIDLFTCLNASKVLDCIADIADTYNFRPLDIGDLFLALNDILGFDNFSECKTKAETETLVLERLQSLDQSPKLQPAGVIGQPDAAEVGAPGGEDELF